MNNNIPERDKSHGQSGNGASPAQKAFFPVVNGNVSQLHPQSGLMSRREAASYLGVTEQTLAIWKCTGRYSLPCVKIGRLVKYRQSDLDAFISRNLKGA